MNYLKENIFFLILPLIFILFGISILLGFEIKKNHGAILISGIYDGLFYLFIGLALYIVEFYRWKSKKD